MYLLAPVSDLSKFSLEEVNFLILLDVHVWSTDRFCDDFSGQGRQGVQEAGHRSLSMYEAVEPGCQRSEQSLKWATRAI